MSSTNISNRPLPYGWTKQIDNQSGQSFYVDTKATPPRSIWTHPYEDEQYLAAHPDVREKLQTEGSRPNTQRRHSYTGPETSNSATKPPKRGFLARLKDKAVGTKEEREAQKRQFEMMQERRRQQRMSAPMGTGSFGQPQYGQPQYGQPQYPQQYGGYGQQYGGYGQQGMGPMGMGTMGGGGMMGRRRGMGGGGMAMPLIGGLAGGLLLGDMLDGGLNDNDYGGGDFGGGDFGGGDFGGGGF